MAMCNNRKNRHGAWFGRHFLVSPIRQVRRGAPRLVAISASVMLFWALILAGGPGLAQAPGNGRLEPALSSIEGVVTVTDQQGQAEAVPGVLVKLTSRASAPDPMSATTDAEGRYAFPKLSPGSYTIDARLDGFKPFAESIVLKQGEAKIENVRLDLDKVVQKVEVRDQAATVLTESPDSTATVSNKQF